MPSKFPSTTLFLPLMIWSKIRPLSFQPGRVLPDQSAASARPILMRLVGRRVQAAVSPALARANYPLGLDLGSNPGLDRFQVMLGTDSSL